MPNILLIEDNTDISNMICDLLESTHYCVTPAYSGTEGLMCFERSNFDLILLDLMLPGKTGQEVLNKIKPKSDIPIIILTAVSDKSTTVELLKLGANDYLTKPFDTDELLARIEVQLRSHLTIQDSLFYYKDITIDSSLFDACISSQAIGLSKREYEILLLLIKNPKKIFTKNNLYVSVWGEKFLGDENTINVHISKIRAKLAAVNANESYIETVWGIGFKLA